MTGHLTSGLLEKQLPKMEATPVRSYITHLKPQFYKAIKKELRELRAKNFSLLWEGQIISV